MGRNARIETARNGADFTIECLGELDLADSPELNRQVTEAVNAAETLTVDFRRVEFIDTAILASLVRAARLLGESGRRLKVLAAERTHPDRVLRTVTVGQHNGDDVLRFGTAHIWDAAQNADANRVTGWLRSDR